MVLALAGATLLYSGCTKDYQKDIDDLHQDVATLQSTVQKLQDQVTALEALNAKVGGLETLIQQCNDAIKKIQDNYATKEELTYAVETLAEEINDALDEIAEQVGYNTEAIEALADAYEAMGEVVESLNLEKFSSVALVPSNPLAEPLYQFALTVGDEFPQTLIETYPQLYLQYAVRPYYLASTLNEENTALHVVYGGNDYYLPINVIEGDSETGNVYVVADVPAELYPLEYFPFSLEIADVNANGVVNNIKSPFNFAFNTGITTNLTYAAYDELTGEAVDEFPAYKIPWNEFETSERTFFDGYALGLQLGWAGNIMSLEEAALCMGVDVEDITPEFEFDYDADDEIDVDEDFWTAEMAAEDAEEAIASVGATATAYAKAYFTIDYLPFYISFWEQDYVVVPSEGKTITIDGCNFPWVGDDFTPAKYIINVEVTEKLEKPLALRNENFREPIFVTPDGELATIMIPRGMFEFAPVAQEYTFEGTIFNVDTMTYDIVEFTVTLDPKPADKVIDLGTFYTDGSATEEVDVDLDGVVVDLVDGDEELYYNFEEDPIYSDIAEEFDWNNEIEKVVVEFADGSVKKLPWQSYRALFAMEFAYDDDEDADESVLTFSEGAAVYGATFTFFGTTEAFGVNYEYTFKVEVADADFALVTTPMVGADNVITDYAEIVDSKYTLNDVYFSDYFEVNKVVNDELFVEFTFSYEDDVDGVAKWDNAETIEEDDIFEVPVNAGLKTLQRTDKYLNWNTYEGRQIFGEATLGYKVDGEFVPVGEALEFTLVTPDPIKSFEVSAITADERVAGKDAKVNLASTLSLKSQIDGKTISPDGVAAADAHKWSWYDLSFGYVEKDDVTELPDTIEGTLNGEDFTFEKGTHYTVDGTEITFLANNAYGTITFTLPVGIRHCYDYGYAEHVANLDVTIPQHIQ